MARVATLSRRGDAAGWRLTGAWHYTSRGQCQVRQSPWDYMDQAPKTRCRTSAHCNLTCPYPCSHRFATAMLPSYDSSPLSKNNLQRLQHQPPIGTLGWMQRWLGISHPRERARRLRIRERKIKAQIVRSVRVTAIHILNDRSAEENRSSWPAFASDLVELWKRACGCHAICRDTANIPVNVCPSLPMSPALSSPPLALCLRRIHSALGPIWALTCMRSPRSA